jgi:GTP:adenosylcobinamide-phosphate guanylyltransferase
MILMAGGRGQRFATFNRYDTETTFKVGDKAMEQNARIVWLGPGSIILDFR